MPSPKPPATLSPAARTLWKRITAQYDVDAPQDRAVLEQALASFDRAQRARERIDQDGEVQPDRFGQLRAHPLLAVERDSRAAFLAGIRQLGFEPPAPKRSGPGRPTTFETWKAKHDQG